jgi:inosine/xanthosine triphosphate pyrophosphatase family protein
MSKKVVLATRNKGKIAEFERLLIELAARYSRLRFGRLSRYARCRETGTTLTENALLNLDRLRNSRSSHPSLMTVDSSLMRSVVTQGFIRRDGPVVMVTI